VCGRAILEGRRAHHVVTVLGAAVGAELRVGLVHGGRGRAVVRALGPGRVELEVAIDRPPSPRPRTALVLALPRPKAVGRALEAAAAAGVARIDLTNAWRVERAYFASARLAPEVLAGHVRLGCEQGGTTFVPEVVVHRRFMALFEGPALAPRPGALRLVAHPGAGEPIEAALPPGSQEPVTLAIGPEGGFIARELDTLVGRGFRAVALGPAILRTEHAITAALAQIELLARLGPRSG
jgi:RsmE family RNA methyltransferase